MNLTPAGLALKWIKRSIEQMFDAKMNAPVLLFTDSANAYSHVMNPLNQARTRHIDVRYKWIIEEVLTNETFTLRLINGSEMVADGLTKSLKAQKHRDFVRMLGLVDGLEDDMDQRWPAPGLI